MTEQNDFLKEIPLDTVDLYNGAVVHLFRDTVRLPNGEEAKREYIRHIGAAAVLPITSEGDALLVKQFRYPFGEVLLEIPAGKRNSFSEDPILTAKRELEEETGYTSEKLISLGEYYPSPAILDERISVYLALDLKPGTRHPDEDEFLLPISIPFGELLRMVESGEIRDGKTQMAVLKASRLLELEAKNT